MKARFLQNTSRRLWRTLWLTYHDTVVHRKSRHWLEAPLIQCCALQPRGLWPCRSNCVWKSYHSLLRLCSRGHSSPPTCGRAAPVYACLVEKNADFTHSALKAVSVPEAKTHRLGKYFVLGYNSKGPNAISAGSVWYLLLLASLRKYIGAALTWWCSSAVFSAERFRVKTFDVFRLLSEFSMVFSLSWFIVRLGARAWLWGPGSGVSQPAERLREKLAV